MAELFLISLLLISLAVIAKDSQQPDVEILEFLGEWETSQGNWFNPLWLLETRREDEKLPENEEQE